MKRDETRKKYGGVLSPAGNFEAELRTWLAYEIPRPCVLQGHSADKALRAWEKSTAAKVKPVLVDLYERGIRPAPVLMLLTCAHLNQYKRDEGLVEILRKRKAWAARFRKDAVALYRVIRFFRHDLSFEAFKNHGSACEQLYDVSETLSHPDFRPLPRNRNSAQNRENELLRNSYAWLICDFSKAVTGKQFHRRAGTLLHAVFQDWPTGSTEVEEGQTDEGRFEEAIKKILKRTPKPKLDIELTYALELQRQDEEKLKLWREDELKSDKLRQESKQKLEEKLKRLRAYDVKAKLVPGRGIVITDRTCTFDGTTSWFQFLDRELEHGSL